MPSSNILSLASFFSQHLPGSWHTLGLIAQYPNSREQVFEAKLANLELPYPCQQPITDFRYLFLYFSEFRSI